VSRRFRPLVLCYHAVSNSWPNILAVTPRALELQLRMLLRRGYRPVTAAETLAGAGRLLHVTFDDAFRSVHAAVPLLERHGVPATVFACSRYADSGGLLDIAEVVSDQDGYAEELATMDWDMLRELVGRGIDVGSHTASHAHLTRLSDRDLNAELRVSRERIEAELDQPCRFLAYPYGEHDGRVEAAARAAGFDAAFALQSRERRFALHAIPRVEMNGRDNLLRATLKTSFVRRPGRAMLRVGHRGATSNDPARRRR
jgi:peptidoglycan/xylan/chitin deacetylase (PgdA/CDA1 family)